MIDVDRPVIELTAADRCDRCGAQAIVLACSEDSGNELVFCGHHILEYHDGLSSKGFFFVADGVQAEQAGYTKRLETLLV